MSFNNLPKHVQELIIDALESAKEQNPEELSLNGNVQIEVEFFVTATMTLDFADVAVAERPAFSYFSDRANVARPGLPPDLRDVFVFEPGKCERSILDVHTKVLESLQHDIELTCENAVSDEEFDSVSVDVSDIELIDINIDEEDELVDWS